MSVSHSTKAYEDCFGLLDQALESDIGLRISCDSKSQAVYLISRLNRARLIDREQNAKIFESGDPRAGVSDYDTLVIRAPKEDEGWWVYVEKRRIIGKIEELKPHATDASRGAPEQNHPELEPVRRGVARAPLRPRLVNRGSQDDKGGS